MGSITLPDIYLITGEDPQDQDAFLQHLQTCVKQGVRLIQLRAHKLMECMYEELAKESIKICRQYNATLLLNCDIKLVEKLDADGAHLSSARLLSLKSRPLSHHKMIGASCHNEIEVLHAKKIEINFITLSPVASTQSHPHAKVMGWNHFADLAAQIDVPLFALGGLGRQDILLSKQHGGHGVAGINAFWDIENGI